jgi:hypothetical protein
MSYFSFLTAMAKHKLDKTLHQPKENPPVHTPAPLNLTQGSVVTISSVPFILAEAAGSRTPTVEEKQIVQAVGKLTLFGREVTRSYLSDGKSFIQTVADPKAANGVGECRLYTNHFEQTPASNLEWAFWLGQKKVSEDKIEEFIAEEEGEGRTVDQQFIDMMRNGETAYIGLEVFDLQDGTRFVRSWNEGSQPVPPQQFSETIYDATGGTTQVAYRAMQYGRRLGQSPTDPSEHLIVAVVEYADEASVNIVLGLDIDPNMLTVVG